MLAQSFKTAAELGIPEEGYRGLQMALVELELEKVPHILSVGRPSPGTIAFDMRTWRSYYHYQESCGTVCCIGGLAQHLIQESPDDLTLTIRMFGSSPNQNNFSVPLRELFHPGKVTQKDYDWDKIKPHHAAKCLRKYLETGVADWTSALAE
jgi:hypothetical protein